MRCLGQLEGLDQGVKLGRDQELKVVALELLERGHDPRQEEVFKNELSRVARVLKGLILGVLSQLRVVVFEQKFVIWEQFENGIDDIVKLLKLTSESTLELLSFLIAAMDFEQLSVNNRVSNRSFVDQKPANLISHLGFLLVLGALLTSLLSLSSSLLLSHASIFDILQVLLDLVLAGFESPSMGQLPLHDSIFDQINGHRLRILCVVREVILLFHEPWENFLMQIALNFRMEQAHARQS